MIRRLHLSEPSGDCAGGIAAWRDALAAELEILSPAQRRSAVTMSVEETGGTWIPSGRTPWGPHYCELSLGGVVAQGEDLDACIATWIKQVARMARAEAEAQERAA